MDSIEKKLTLIPFLEKGTFPQSFFRKHFIINLVEEFVQLTSLASSYVLALIFVLIAHRHLLDPE